MAAIAKVVLMVWMLGLMFAALKYAPAVEGLGEAGRVLYFHVPVAWISVLAFCMSLYHSIQVLRKGNEIHDVGAEVSARLGLWFCTLATISGAIFAKYAWKSYWNWDPRETSIVVLMLVYMAYFGLRSAIPDPDKRMRIAAVYAILTFVVMPLTVFVLPRSGVSLHPDTMINAQMENKISDMAIGMVFTASLAGFTGIFAWMYNLSMRVERLIRAKEGSDV